MAVIQNSVVSISQCVGHSMCRLKLPPESLGRKRVWIQDVLLMLFILLCNVLLLMVRLLNDKGVFVNVFRNQRFSLWTQ